MQVGVLLASWALPPTPDPLLLRTLGNPFDVLLVSWDCDGVGLAVVWVGVLGTRRDYLVWDYVIRVDWD